MTAPFRRLAVIGLGLIGGSVARAAHESGIARSIVAADDNELSLGYAMKQGFVSQTFTDPAKAVQGSDVVVIAAPTHALGDICEAIADHLAPGTLVMDTGSVKQAAGEIMQAFLPAHAVIVPAHPIAGSEQSGVAAASAGLFAKKRVIITPEAPLTHESLKTVNRFWEALGARVEAMPASLHDTVYGYVSHLPQLIAFAIAGVIPASGANDRFLRLCGSSHTLWSGIFLLNRDILSVAASRYLDVLVHIRKELQAAPPETEPEQSDMARDVLLPRIIASCLVTTVMEAEKRSGLPFVRYAGSGFADFTSPAATDPEHELAEISSHYAQVAELLLAVEARMSRILDALASADASLIAGSLE